MDKNLDFFTPTITMYISSPKIKEDCSDVKKILRKLGVMGNITPNQTLTPVEENGCQIIFQGPAGIPRTAVRVLSMGVAPQTPRAIMCKD